MKNAATTRTRPHRRVAGDALGVPLRTRLRIRPGFSLAACTALFLVGCGPSPDSRYRAPAPPENFQPLQHLIVTSIRDAENVVPMVTPLGSSPLPSANLDQLSPIIIGRVDVPGAGDIHIEIDSETRHTPFAGLTFTAPCIVAIRADGTLTADKEGIVATDAHQQVWESHHVTLAGEDSIAFFPRR